MEMCIVKPASDAFEANGKTPKELISETFDKNCFLGIFNQLFAIKPTTFYYRNNKVSIWCVSIN